MFLFQFSNDQSQLQHPEPSTSTAGISNFVEVSENETLPLQILQSSEYAKNDIGHFVGKSNVSNEDKEMLLRRPWEPLPSHKTHVQVIGSKKRTFQIKWLQRFPWLAYSEKLNGTFCKFCVLFSQNEVGQGSHESPENLVKKPFNKWKDAIEIFEKHSRTKYHERSRVAKDDFLHIFDGHKQNIVEQLQNKKMVETEKNRQILQSIIEAIIFCGRQELSLRGHRDSGRLSLEEPNTNDGNFRALLRFRANHGDNVLANHILSSAGNAMYVSPVVQNELINLIGDQIQTSILDRVKKSVFFTILADETTDISRVEQFSFCVRYIDNESMDLREDFLTFVPVYDVTGAGIANTIQSQIKRFGLDLENVRGQGYDGASAMRGEFNGVQAIIQRDFPKAVYTHCTSHCLNLCLSDAAKTPSIRNCFSTISEVCSYFKASAKRSKVLKDALVAAGKNNTGLHNYCETRWVERHDAVSVFNDCFDSIIDALEIIMNSNEEASTKATSLHTCLCKFEFIITLTVMSKMLSLTYIISKYLQKESVDISSALSTIELTVNTFSQMRKSGDEEFHTLYKKAEDIANKLGVPVHGPRTVGTQRYRSNVESKTPEEYYRRTVFYPYLDEILASLKERFSNHRYLLKGLDSLIPVKIVSKTFSDLQPALEFYKDDLQHTSKDILEAEWNLWALHWKGTDSPKPKNAVETLKLIDKEMFPNLTILLTVLAILPVTTSSVERTFSTLKRLKGYLRNSTGDERLTSLALMTVHRDIKVNVSGIINRYIQRNRRLSFT